MPMMRTQEEEARAKPRVHYGVRCAVAWAWSVCVVPSSVAELRFQDDGSFVPKTFFAKDESSRVLGAFVLEN